MKSTLWIIVFSALLVAIHSTPVISVLGDTGALSNTGNLTETDDMSHEGDSNDLEVHKEEGDLGPHTLEDVLAQASCSAYMPIGPAGWMYAVRRSCISQDSCADVCNSKQLQAQDRRTASRTWGCIGAVHVYKNRPPTGNGKTPTLGLKTHFYEKCNASGRCGPNYCCCKVYH